MILHVRKDKTDGLEMNRIANELYLVQQSSDYQAFPSTVVGVSPAKAIELCKGEYYLQQLYDDGILDDKEYSE